jgi:hypothetical protein
MTRRARIVAVVTVAVLALSALGARIYTLSETIGPQPPQVGLVERQMKRQMRRGWLRVLLHDKVLEVRVNGEAVLGYTGRPPDLDSVNPGVVQGIAKKAIDLYTPPQFGAPPGVDSVRVRLRHAYMLGPFTYRVRGRDFTFSTGDLGR